MKNKILLSLFLLLNPFFILGNNWTDDKNYAEEVNTLIGTKGLGLLLIAFVPFLYARFLYII